MNVNLLVQRTLACTTILGLLGFSHLALAVPAGTYSCYGTGKATTLSASSSPKLTGGAGITTQWALAPYSNGLYLLKEMDVFNDSVICKYKSTVTTSGNTAYAGSGNLTAILHVPSGSSFTNCTMNGVPATTTGDYCYPSNGLGSTCALICK